MTALFRLDSSIRAEGSSTRHLGDIVQNAVGDATDRADLRVIGRDVGQSPVPSTVWSDSLAAGATDAARRTPDQLEALTVTTSLADELEDSDAYLFTVPLYNWGVPQHVKTWVDVVVTDPRFSPRSTTIAGRPAVLVIARGGDYRVGADRAEWDHASSWLRRILSDVWHLDVTTVEVGLTLAPSREHMAHLRDDAAADLARAERQARTAGLDLGRAVGRRAVA